MSPVYYNHWYVNGDATPFDTYSPPSAPVPANYKIPSIRVTYNPAGTSATIVFTPPTSTPGSYGGAIGSVNGFNPFSDLEYRVINTTSNTYTATGLTPGKTYYLRIRAFSGAGQTGVFGDYYYDKLVPPKPSSVSSTTSTTSATKTAPSSANDVNVLENKTVPRERSVIPTGTSVAVSNNRAIQTSLFRITNNSPDKNKYSIAIKDSKISTSYQYYAFGTSMFFQSNVSDVQGSGGIGFFTSENGMDGYYVEVQTTSNLSDTTDKEVKIVKISSGKKTILNDTQTKSASKTLTGILGGISYKVDINVINKSNIMVIDVYINNFKITAIDSSDVLPVTSNVALFASTGKASFDYIYASPITESQYNQGIIQNIYLGKYGSKTLSFLYGDKIINEGSISTSQVPFLEEFGTVAREIKRIKIKYEDRPGNPMYTSIGINKYVDVLGQRLTSFGAEVYVINNSGTFVPLDDSNLYSFSIVGNYIVTSGQHEYVSNTLSETTIPEPAIFESSWIQSEPDAKNLTLWIQEQWSKKQQIVELQTVANPLISVGDIVSISYPKNGLNGNEKFVVTRVQNSFGEGLETSITARSIFS